MRNDEGIFLVLYALLILGLLLMVAIVVDLSALRADRRLGRSSADAAATAGALDLKIGSESACNAAWAYALENLDLDLSVSSPCTGFPQCDPATSTSSVGVTGSAGDYSITITNPVVDTDPLLRAEAVGGSIAQTINTDADGQPCNRLGVEIAYTRKPFFAKVAGIQQSRTSVHSVGLRLTDDDGVPLSLVVLHPTNCGVITSSGSGGIRVTGTASPDLVGGILAVSTGANCGGPLGPRVLNVGGDSHITVEQPGHIFIAAMNGPVCTDPACANGQYDSSLPYDRGFNPYPQDPRVVPDRGLVDGRYNCRANYDSAGSDPNYRVVYKRGTSGAILPACTSTQVTTPESDFVNHLVRSVNAGALEPVAPTIYTDCGTLPPTITGPSRIDCALPNNFTLTVDGDAWFNNSSILSPSSLVVNGNAVFNGGITLGTGNSLTINGNAQFRSGEIRVSGPTVGGGSFTLQGDSAGLICTLPDFVLTPDDCVRQSSSLANFAYLGPNVTAFRLTGGSVSMPATTVFGSGGPTATDTTGPLFDLGGGGSVSWLAPSAGTFHNLLAWSDKISDMSPGGSSTWHNLSGGGGLNLEGIFFSPLAKVRMTGGSTITPLRAQFWAGDLEQDGGGVFSMTPDGSFILVPVGEGTRLIR